MAVPGRTVAGAAEVPQGASCLLPWSRPTQRDSPVSAPVSRPLPLPVLGPKSLPVLFIVGTCVRRKKQQQQLDSLVLEIIIAANKATACMRICGQVGGHVCIAVW